MFHKVTLFVLTGFILCLCVYVVGAAVVVSVSPDPRSFSAENASETIEKTPWDEEDPVRQAKMFEDGWKKMFKQGVKLLLPRLMDSDTNIAMSSKCMRSFTKYIGALTSAKLWAAQMIDATSKIPAGIFEGTFTDFGAFDECLGIMVPLRNGKEDFRGSYCSIEARPRMLPIPKNFSLAIRRHAGPHDTIGKEILLAGGGFYYLQFRFGVCVPSACSVEDIRSIASKVANTTKMNIEVPRCYVKEDHISFSAVHITVICTLIVLTLLCVVGTRIDFLMRSESQSGKTNSLAKNALMAFSLRQNYKKLFAQSQGGGELKALHGIRGLSIAWVILGHTYVWTNLQLLRRPSNLQDYFNQVEFEAILNAWLSVEPFFFLSGLLICYGCMQMMEKTKGKINIPFFIIRRYIRLVPPLLMVMGLVFFLPLVSSGPFWYERVDTELESCRKNWWTSLLMISNWTSMRSICIHPTWYLSADFQLHILSLSILIPLYRSAKLGGLAMAVFVSAGNMTVAVLTYLLELPPIILISSGNNEQIIDTVDKIHIRTFTHVGPYMIGMTTGYLILKYKEVKLSKMTVACGWCASFVVSVASLYGVHTWNTGHAHGPLVTSLYAAVHRSTFTVGVAWVAYACVTGHAGPVNKMLASPALAPLSRLTFCIYLTQSLAMWTRRASERERMYYSHYNQLYEYMGNFAVSVLLAIPLHFLVEAPVSNLDRFIFSATRVTAGQTRSNVENPTDQKASSANGLVSNSMSSIRTSTTSISNAVELKSVRTVQESNPYNRNQTDRNGIEIKE